MARKKPDYRYNSYEQFQNVKSLSLYWNEMELEIPNPENQSRKSIFVVYNSSVMITVSAARIWACGGRCVGGYGIGIMLRVLGKAMNRFQCTWIVMIDEMYRLIVEYLGNKFR